MKQAREVDSVHGGFGDPGHFAWRLYGVLFQVELASGGLQSCLREERTVPDKKVPTCDDEILPEQIRAR